MLRGAANGIEVVPQTEHRLVSFGDHKSLVQYVRGNRTELMFACNDGPLITHAVNGAAGKSVELPKAKGNPQAIGARIVFELAGDGQHRQRAVEIHAGSGYLSQSRPRLDVPALPLGVSAQAAVGDDVVIAGGGGLAHAVAARIIAKQEFAGYWEYVLDEALFVSPAHTNWGGTALLNGAGELIGIGSLQIQRGGADSRQEDANMIVPIDLLKPILTDLERLGRPNRPARLTSLAWA